MAKEMTGSFTGRAALRSIWMINSSPGENIPDSEPSDPKMAEDTISISFVPWSLPLEGLHLLQALQLEGDVAHGQHLVHQQDGRVHVDGHGEPQAHVHPGRIELHLVVDEGLQLGEGDDVVEDAVGLLLGEPEDG